MKWDSQRNVSSNSDASSGMRFWITVVALISMLLAGCNHNSLSGSMTIRAVASTGGTFYTPHPQPIWTFAVTNTGRCELHWQSGIEVKGGGDTNYSHAGGFIEWPEGILAPGEGVETNMIVPAKTGIVWRAYVEWWTTSMRHMETYNDKWHH
jgi:hypothetical protein